MDADLASALRQAIDARRVALAERIDHLRGIARDSDGAVAAALGLFNFFPKALGEVVSQEWDRNRDPISRVQLLRPLLRHANEVTAFLDEWFAEIESHHFPFHLADSVERKCIELKIGNRKAMIAPARAGEFSTIVVDIGNVLFNALGPLCPPVPQELRRDLVLMRAPRFEGRHIWWHPILLGHEFGHLVARSRDGLASFDVDKGFDFDTARKLPGPGAAPPGLPTSLRLREIAASWAEELLCDAHVVRAYGAAGVAALAEYLEVVGATDVVSVSHPPGRLRIKLAVQWLGEIQNVEIDAIVAPWRDLAGQPQPRLEPWVQFLIDYFLSRVDDISLTVSTWGERRKDDARKEVVAAAVTALRSGVPPEPVVQTSDGKQAVGLADVVTAAWIGRMQQFPTPVGSLSEKALSDFEFLRRWSEAGGTLLRTEETFCEVAGRSGADEAVLSANELTERLHANGDGRLTITPLLPDFASGASVDLRLGNGFIVFARSQTTSFDPLQQEVDLRQVQRKVELSWGEKFVLHPSELVLAATLEYIVLPGDLTAQVVSRSSYGRLGLLSATAVQVHPYFHGCLTLELVNVSTVPLVLTPGERIAQLVVSRTGMTDRPAGGKYHCPIGPEFSKVRSDDEAAVLRKLTARLDSAR